MIAHKASRALLTNISTSLTAPRGAGAPPFSPSALTNLLSWQLNVQEAHKQERQEMLAMFTKTLEEKRKDYKEEIDQIVSRFSCRADYFKKKAEDE